MKLLAFTRKTLVELFREPALLGMGFGFPLLLVLVYYAGFGRSDKGMAEYMHVLVVNEDGGAAGPDGNAVRLGDALVDEFRKAEFDGKPAFDVRLVANRAAAEASLRERKAAVLVVVPREFTAALLEAAAGRPRDPPVDVALVGDPVANANYVLAVGYLDGIVQQLAGAVTSRPQTADLRWEFLPGTGKLSDFDFGVPGLVVFGILFVVMTASTPLVREKVSGTLKRLRLSRARASDLLGGVTLSQLAVSVIQIPLVFGLAVAFGFHGAGSLPLAMGVGLLLTLTAVGLGCIVACLARNDGEAAAVSSAFLLPLALLSGGLFPMPDATVATIGGQAISLFDVLPTRHAAEALRRILVLGAGPGDVVYQVVMLAVLSVLTLLVGTALYRRLRLRAG